MRNSALLKVLVVLVGLLAPMFMASAGNAAATCPNPLPACTSSSSTTVSILNGTYGCTQVRTDAASNGGTGLVKVAVMLLNFDGAGKLSGKEAQNANDPNLATTFQDFAAASGTYCVNSDNSTGYVTPSGGSGGCPLAFVIDSSNSEVRLLDTSEQRAEAITCRKQ